MGTPGVPLGKYKGAEQFLQLQCILQVVPSAWTRAAPQTGAGKTHCAHGCGGRARESGAWLGRKMIGNKNTEERRNPQLLVSGKTIHMEVLVLKISPGKGSLMQKGV